MVRLTFYGGINEIGGNKILLEDGERKLFLDFGFPYKRQKLFYEEYLKPRGGAGLLDHLAMALIPPLEGLYRSDLEILGLWEGIKGSPLYRKLGSTDGVLLSHAHLDHAGHLPFLKGDIPIYSTGVTAFILKAMQDSGKSGIDQQICFFTDTVQKCPSGWKQTACLSSNGKKQRLFKIADIAPEKLSTDAVEFWSNGFWQNTSRKEITTQPLAPSAGSAFDLRCLPVDHSIPGACAWAIKTSQGWIVYSGDLRFHGKRGSLTDKFVEAAASLRPRALIMEGTNVSRRTNTTEAEVYENALEAIKSADSLVIADFAPRDIDRLLTFLQIAKETDRKLAILAKDAYLLKTMRLLEPQTPDINDDNLVIYQETTASPYPSPWLKSLFQEYESKTVLAGDVSAAQGQFILCFSFFDLNELPSLQPKPGSLYVFSSSEPHDEEQEIDFRRLHNWIKRFHMKSVGLPVKIGNDWLIPENERGLHASGHACGTDLLDIARRIKPEILLPVHCLVPGFFAEQLQDSGIRVILPEAGKPVEIGE